MTDALRASYDATPYQSKPISATHLDELAAVARLHGLSPASPDACRVLEIGCASGGNIVPMAFRYPGSTFLGIDLSPAQIDEGRRTIASLGFQNISLEARSIVELDATAGPFDYIICHGVFSWVPGDVREAILRVCGECLAPAGVAYVSYNTYPGWHARMLLRQMMIAHDDRSLAPLARVARARAFVERIGARATAVPGAYAATFQHELSTLRSQPDSQVLHEQLEEFNQPMLFTEFVASAQRHGLQYIADARISQSRWPDPDAHTTANRAEVVCREQEGDYIAGQTFRRSLLCRAEASIDASAAQHAVRALYAVMRAVQVTPKENDADENGPGVRVFRAPEGVRLGSASALLLAVFDELGEAGPASMSLADLDHAVRRRLGHAGALTTDAAEQLDELPALLLRLARAGMIGFLASPSAFVTRIGERPTASALARWQAEQRAFIADQRHASVKLPTLAIFLLPYLDGTRDHHQLVGEVERALDDGRLSVGSRPDSAAIAAAVDESLRCLASSALLVS